MLRNYVKVALRNVRRAPGYSFISVFGLAVGMTCCLFLLLYVYDELNYDRFYEKADRVFRVVTDVVAHDGTVDSSAYSFTAVGPAMLRGMPNVEAATRLEVRSSLLRVGATPFTDQRALVVDSSFFDLFTYRFLQGNPKTALNRPFTVVLTRSTAQRYFGDENPVGRTINLDNRDDLEVTAVIDDPPPNTHLRFDVLLTFATHNARHPGFFDNNWRVLYGYTYVLLSGAAQAEVVEAGLPDLTQPYLALATEQSGATFRFTLQPLTRIHLHSHRDHEVEPGGRVAYVNLLATTALLLLLIACINFVNMSTAQGTARAREVGVRKVVGASRAQLTRQFLVESMVLATIALGLAVLLFTMLLPVFNQLSGKAFTGSVLGGLVVPAGFLAVALVAGIAGGSYPAFVLSAFRPVRVLKGMVVQGRSGAPVRKGLVAAEFAAAIVLIVGAVVIYQQLRYMRTADLGFDKDQVVVIPHVFPSAAAGQMQTIKDELLRGPAVKGVTLASEWPTRLAEGQLSFRVESMPVGEGFEMAWYQTDEDYLDVLDVKLAAGRAFSSERASDSAAVLINQTAARQFGLADDEAVGARIRSPERDEAWGAIVGVVKDFHTRSLHDPVDPVVIVYSWARPRRILVKIDGRNVPGALAHLEETWARHMPGFPLNPAFIDQQYDALYRAEERLSRVVKTFAVLAILLACLGLFGLAALSARQRTKEVGIRKVLGATVGSIVVLLSGHYLRLVAIAFVVAAPPAYVAMEKWLENFAYRIDLDVGVFVAAGALALLVAVATVSYQAVRAALANPVETLRYE